MKFRIYLPCSQTLTPSPTSHNPADTIHFLLVSHFYPAVFFFSSLASHKSQSSPVQLQGSDTWLEHSFLKDLSVVVNGWQGNTQISVTPSSVSTCLLSPSVKHTHCLAPVPTPPAGQYAQQSFLAFTWFNRFALNKDHKKEACCWNGRELNCKWASTSSPQWGSRGPGTSDSFSLRCYWGCTWWCSRAIQALCCVADSRQGCHHRSCM